MQLSASHGLDGALADSKDNQDSLHHLPDGALADSKDNKDKPFAISSSCSLPRLLLGASAGLPASLTLGASGHLVERLKLGI